MEQRLPPVVSEISTSPLSALRSGEDPAAVVKEQLLLPQNSGISDQDMIAYLFATRRTSWPDARRITRSLWDSFGGLPAILAADSDTLQQIPGMNADRVGLIKAINLVALRLLAAPLNDRPILSSWQALLDYLRADMAHLVHERVRILHLNSKNHLIRDDLISEGSIDESAIYPREVIRRALILGSAALILVHNHPSGDASPSRQDIQITKDIRDAGRPLGISVHDHVIIGHSGHVSMRSRGLL